MHFDREDLILVTGSGLLIYAIIYLIACIRKKKFTPFAAGQGIMLFVFCCYGAVVLHITGILELLLLRYPPGTIVRQNLLSGFHWDLFRGHVFRPVYLNFLLFVPFGFFAAPAIPQIRWNLLRALLLGFCVSFSIELLQGLIGRVQELDDVIMNTGGTVAGYAVWTALFSRKYTFWQRVLLIVLTVALSYAGVYEVRELCLNAVGG